MEKTFSTLAELQAEIQFLKVQQFKQEEVLKEHLSSPKAILSTIGGLFKADSGRQSFVKDLVNQDLITNISRVILPIFLNGVVFKRSGFITKTLVTFLSQKAAKQVNSHSVTGIVDKITGLFKKKGDQKTTAPRIKDYGIPPDSETY
ncbi:hypothetical protein [Desertivirga xinjiangensis]|uniref:hypothetical protein n=1 Tax=Desertivirga xinjiangensis TaxID=539206 RepID=UPI00210DF955|nr:hypothetical protein [Pedobacter xinjiangensis]